MKSNKNLKRWFLTVISINNYHIYISRIIKVFYAKLKLNTIIL